MTQTIDLTAMTQEAADAAPAPVREGGKFAVSPEDKALRAKRAIFDQVRNPGVAPKEAAPEGTKEPSAEKSAEVSSPPKPKRSPALDSARKTLELDGWEEADFAALPEERALALAEKARARHAEIGTKLRAAKAASKSDGEATPAAKASEPRPAEPAQPIDLKARLKPVLDELAISDESGSALTAALSSLVDPLRSELEEAKGELQTIKMAKLEREVGDARKELSERFPKLAEDSEFEDFLAEASALVPGLQASGRAKTVQELFESVARLRGYEEKKPVDTAKSDALSRKRDAGQPLTNSRASQPRALSTEQRKRQYFDALRKGEEPDAAQRRIFGG